MNRLVADDFPAYFSEVHGVAPFSWQEDLARDVVREGWPQGIDVPTGMGKTAVIDIAVFALAVQVGDPRRTVPTRTFIVVDRRLIVDQAFDRASLLAAELRGAARSSVVGRVAENLRVLASGDDPLVVVRMRGGTTWGWRWLARPSQPAVVLATVDQFGSRLLFRGYGVGRSLRPIDAALCGADSLLILDEAHLSRPLTETMRFVRDHEGRAEQPVLGSRHPQPVLMSATLPIGVPTYRLDLDAELSQTARNRLDAQRIVHLVDLGTHKDPVPELATALAALARSSIVGEGIERVAVVCNTVQLARRAFELLVAEHPDDVDVVLLVGRCRQHERDRLSERWLPRLVAAADRPPAAAIIAVATQTIEVGADFDVDSLITEASPLDALLQRLGRLNRLGRRTSAEATVVRAASRHDDDPVYGQATRRTWDWLVEEAGAPDRTTSRRIVESLVQAPSLDLGARALADLLQPGQRSALSAEPSLAPVVLGPMLRAWACTSPSPVPDQAVAPYLHGIARPASEVLVCWRAGLPSPVSDQVLEAWREELRTTPVRSHETVSVPIWEAKRFLAGAPTGEVADIEGAPSQDDEVTAAQLKSTILACMVGSDGKVSVADDRSLRPGVTLVVPSDAGGHDEWGWAGGVGTRQAVPDVADLAQRRRPRLRLRPAVVGVGVGAGTDQAKAWRVSLTDCSSGTQSDVVPDQEKVRRLLAEIPAAVEGQLEPRLVELLDDLRAHRPLRITIVGVPGRTWMVVEGRYPSTKRELPHLLSDLLSDEDDFSSSALQGHGEVTLEKHLWDVAREAERQAALLGLPPPLVAAVELAARAHDLGKADRRFQAMLNRGSALAALARSEPLAKSGMDPTDRNSFRAARLRSGWPSGMRHEAVSAALVRQMAALPANPFADVDFDLVHHLVQTHHGRGRPLLPAVKDHAPEIVRVCLPGSDLSAEASSDDGLIDWDGPSRFDRLGRRYGWWGLALLESIVRLADLAVSEAYQREQSK